MVYKLWECKCNKRILEEGTGQNFTKRNFENNRLFFSSDIEDSIKKSEVIVIAVGTPQGENGMADMSFVYSVVDTISNNLNNYK